MNLFEKASPSGWTLILANLFAIALTLWSDLTLGEVMLIYWCENVIIGIFSIPKLIYRPGRHFIISILSSIFLVPFFVIHYGGFCLGHFFFIVTMFFRTDPNSVLGDSKTKGIKITELSERLDFEWLGPIIFAFVLSHLFSAFYNFQNDKANMKKKSDPMFDPYRRIIVLHIGIIFGGGIVQATGGSNLALIFFMGLKTLADFFWHLKHHYKRHHKRRQSEEKTKRELGEIQKLREFLALKFTSNSVSPPYKFQNRIAPLLIASIPLVIAIVLAFGAVRSGDPGFFIGTAFMLIFIGVSTAIIKIKITPDWVFFYRRSFFWAHFAWQEPLGNYQSIRMELSKKNEFGTSMSYNKKKVIYILLKLLHKNEPEKSIVIWSHRLSAGFDKDRHYSEVKNAIRPLINYFSTTFGIPVDP